MLMFSLLLCAALVAEGGVCGKLGSAGQAEILCRGELFAAGRAEGRAGHKLCAAGGAVELACLGNGRSNGLGGLGSGNGRVDGCVCCRSGSVDRRSRLCGSNRLGRSDGCGRSDGGGRLNGPGRCGIALVSGSGSGGCIFAVAEQQNTADGVDKHEDYDLVSRGKGLTGIHFSELFSADNKA